jgi:hypothetical protein
MAMRQWLFPRAQVVALSSIVAVTGCGGGSGSSSSSSLSIADGQDPDPVILDFPVAYVQRELVLVDEDGDPIVGSVRDAAAFFPGAELYLRDRASPSAEERSITIGVFPNDVDGNPPKYDVKDLSVSFDGESLAFAMRAPEDPALDEDEQPTWNIWSYHLPSDTLVRVIPSDITAEAGQDVAPRFLPDGRIVFSSTRQRQSKAILLDEGKPQFAALDEDRDSESFTLHVMNEDGSDVHQISFNQSSDLDPNVLSDGRIVYARWDNVNNIDTISLYSMLPDGREQRLLYGRHSTDTGPNGETIAFTEPQELPDGRLLVAMRPDEDTANQGAALVAVDTGAYVEHDQPTFANQGLIGDAQEILIEGDFRLGDTPSPRGRFASVHVLEDGSDRVLVTWSQCRLIEPGSDPLNPVILPCTDQLLADPTVQEAAPLYGVWMYDPINDTQQPIVIPAEGWGYTEAVVMQDRPSPPVLLDGVPGLDLDPDLVSENVGLVHIRSVYDFDGVAQVDIPTVRDPLLITADQRPVQFVRFVKAVSIPDDDIVDLDNSAFGVSQNQLMREILGYARVEPDGSMMVKVPANVAFGINVLDIDGRRVSPPRHQNWMTLRPGEVMDCNGCHTPQSELPHGRPDAEAPTANDGAPTNGPFLNTDPLLIADEGETMAETYARLRGVANVSVDLRFEDVWTDPAGAPAATRDYGYSGLTTTPPVDTACVASWNATCRIVINYEEHIHPLWSAPRTIAADVDVTCTNCHTRTDAAGADRVPDGQLDLTDGQSDIDPDHFHSYRELFSTDDQQELNENGVLVNTQVQDGFLTNANGDLVLDPVTLAPIPVFVNVPVGPSLSPVGAMASTRFFSRFDAGGSHDGWLSPAELKLIAEHVDIGAQYFNDPFAVPQ